MGDLLRDAASADPEREAYVHGEKRVTYGWLDRAADGFRGDAPRRGRRPGRRRGAAAPLVDQVRGLLPGRAPSRRDHLRGEPAPGAVGADQHLRPHRADGHCGRRRGPPARGCAARTGHRRGRPEGRLRRRPAAPGAPPPRRRPDLHRVDERHHRPAEGRRLRPRDPGVDLAQHRPAHRAGRPAARRAPVPPRRLHDPHVGRAGQHDHHRAGRRAVVGRRDAAADRPRADHDGHRGPDPVVTGARPSRPGAHRLLDAAGRRPRRRGRSRPSWSGACGRCCAARSSPGTRAPRRA